MKEYTIYYRGTRRVKGLTKADAFNKADKLKPEAYYIQDSKYLFFDSFLDNAPFLLSIFLWIILIFTTIGLVKTINNITNSEIKILYLLVFLSVFFQYPHIGKMVGLKLHK